MKEIYEKYIEAKRGAWSEASIRSESIRLNKVMDQLDGDGQKLWLALGAIYSKHTRVTVYNRVCAFFDWAIKKGHIVGPNPYALWREESPRCFQGFYVRRPPGMTFIDAKTRIETLKDPEMRAKCLQLLTSGMRWSESYTLTPDSYVTGKGGKLRRVYPMSGLGPMAAQDRYRAVLRQLKKLGIKGPHRLRGIFLTECVRRKVDTFDLKEIAGWSSLATAESYIQANQEKIKETIAKIHEEVT